VAALPIEPHLGTATRIATDLRHWVCFLVNERNYPTFIDDRDPVLMATEDDFAAFYRRSQYPESSAPDEGRDVTAGAMTSGSWAGVRSAIKRLYEHLNRIYQHPMPLAPVPLTAAAAADGVRWLVPSTVMVPSDNPDGGRYGVGGDQGCAGFR
jgi:hypothetical protein